MFVIRLALGSTTAILLFSAFTFVFAQTPIERRTQIQTDVNQRDHRHAVTDLRSFQIAAPNVFTANNYDYLLGREAERVGDLASAAVNYQSVAARKSVLAQYAIWHLAALARASGDLPREREQLRILIATAPNSLLRSAANKRLPQSYFESQDYAGAIALLKPVADAVRNTDSREALALMARSYLAMGQVGDARAAYTDLLTHLPNPAQPDDLSLESVRALDQMDSGVTDKATQLPEPELLRRAIVYQFNRDFAHARTHYGEIVIRFPQSANVPDALFQIGRGFYSERNYDQSLVYLKRVIDEFPTSQSAPDAVNFAAGSLVRLKRIDEAVTYYQKAINDFPTAPTPERPYLNLIDALRDSGRDAEALQWADTTQKRFAGQPAAGQAMFERARIHFQSGDWNGALADLAALRALPALPGMTLNGGTTPSEISFLQGYALEQLGRYDEAITTYLSIIDGRNEYYGWRATLRLLGLAADPRSSALINARRTKLNGDLDRAFAAHQYDPARLAAQSLLRLTNDKAENDRLLGILRQCYAALPSYSNVPNQRELPAGRTEIVAAAPAIGGDVTHKAIAAELLFLGLYDEGSVELATTDPGDSQSFGQSSPDAAFTQAMFYLRGDQANNAVRYAEPLWKTVPADFVVALAPRPMVQLLYPSPYADALLLHAPPRGVDPRMVLAIARVESRYRPEVKSYAAARGLMQFISATADQIAAEIPRPGFKQEDLYNPSVAIQFGSQYLSDLYKLFPDQPQAVAGSYNAGEDNLARWIARARSTDPDRYVCELAISQAKDYVFKVVAGYRVYQMVYDEKLNPR